jgi:RimJ/RimL family protein N-acetyltransferase
MSVISASSVMLSGTHVRLEPLVNDHLSAIQAAANDGQLWKLFFTTVPSFEKTQQWLDTALEMQKQEKAIPFAVRSLLSGEIIGSTRYCNIDHNNKIINDWKLATPGMQNGPREARSIPSASCSY